MIDGALVDTIDGMLVAHPALFDRLAHDVTFERAHHILAALESAPTPSQTARWTRVPVVESLLEESGLLAAPRVTWHRDFDGSGNAALMLGRDPRRKRVWGLAHLDQISYLVDPGDGARYPLAPLCYHMQQDGKRPALALAHDLARGTLTVRAHGVIDVDGSTVSFLVHEGSELGPGTRVVYDSPLTWDRATNRLTGSLDDSVACTALLLAADVLRHYPVEVLIGLTDEEEGPPGNANQSFCRGGRRLIDALERPDLIIVSDVHESEAMIHGVGPRDLHPGDGAVFAERSSDGRGGVTPPHVYALQQHLAAALQRRGIRLRENWGGYVSRSEDINAVAITPNVALLGVLCSNRHFAMDTPAANLADVLDLTKSFVAYTLLVHSDLWQTVAGAPRSQIMR
jgi:putative aminopeptidase FrvX